MTEFGSEQAREKTENADENIGNERIALSCTGLVTRCWASWVNLSLTCRLALARVAYSLILPRADFSSPPSFLLSLSFPPFSLLLSSVLLFTPFFLPHLLPLLHSTYPPPCPLFPSFILPFPPPPSLPPFLFILPTLLSLLLPSFSPSLTL